MIDNLTFFQAIIGFLVILTPIVFIHELGHFIFARLFGVEVEKFSIGFGPVLFFFHDKNKTKWQIAAIPIGGFVKMKGELNVVETNENKSETGSFQLANPFQRLLIVFGGPLFNFLLTILLIAGIYLFFGKVEISNTVNEVVESSPADIAGIVPGDKIISINGIKVKNFEQISQIIFESPNKLLKLEVLRNNTSIFLKLKPESVWSDDLKIFVGKLGIISNKGDLKQFGISESIYNSFIDTVFITQSMIRGIIKFFSGNAQKGEIGGPVKIAEISGKALASGLIPLIYICAILSLNLAIVNLLPIPALDGGHIILFLIEIIIGKPLPLNVQNILMRTGMSLLLSFMIFIIIFDISSYF